MKPAQRSAISVALSTLLAVPLPAAPIGTAFTYQGRLTVGGSPATGTYDLQFQLYDALTSGTSVAGPLNVASVPVSNGLFTVTLDFGGAFNGQQRWLETRVQPAGGGGYTTLTPRQEMTATPNALYAVTATTINGLGCMDGDIPKWSSGAWVCGNDLAGTGTVTSVGSGAGLTGGPITSSGTLAVDLGGSGAATTVSRSDHNHVGQTWTASATGLSVETSGLNALVGRATAATGDPVGVHGRSDSSSGAGVFGYSSGTVGGHGVWGIANSPAGRGVYGANNATTGSAAGVYGQSSSTNGGIGVVGVNSETTGFNSGVFGQVSSSGGRGVFGQALSTIGGTGVRGTTPAVGLSSSGVLGTASATAGQTYGVWGENYSSQGIGVYGAAFSSIGSTYGVFGWATSPTGSGVYGVGASTTGANYGVQGISSSAAGLGGHFYNTSAGTGLLADSANVGSVPLAVKGMVGQTANLQEWRNSAGTLLASVASNGFLAKTAGGFVIDHPLEPENKYLYHSFVESPDMKNFYDGVVTTDQNGYATISLPAWFEALNRDFRYQLTVMDDGDSAAFVQAKVARKIANNQFTIRTSLPGAEVSWLVTGIRKDAWAVANPMAVERDKKGASHSPEP